MEIECIRFEQTTVLLETEIAVVRKCFYVKLGKIKLNGKEPLEVSNFGFSNRFLFEIQIIEIACSNERYIRWVKWKTDT